MFGSNKKDLTKDKEASEFHLTYLKEGRDEKDIPKDDPYWKHLEEHKKNYV